MYSTLRIQDSLSAVIVFWVSECFPLFCCLAALFRQLRPNSATPAEDLWSKPKAKWPTLDAPHLASRRRRAIVRGFAGFGLSSGHARVLPYFQGNLVVVDVVTFGHM